MPAPSGLRLKGRAFVMGLGLILAWWVGAYAYLDGQRDAALAKIRPCAATPPPSSSASSGVLDAIGSLGKRAANAVADYFTECNSRVRDETSAANGIVYKGMLGAVVASPLLFFVSGFIVRKQVAHSVAAEEAARTAKAAREAQAHQAAQEGRQRTLFAENRAAKEKISRAEFVKKLGLVTDSLDLLLDPSAKGSESLLRQNIAIELRDIVAKHPLPDLEALIVADPVIQYKLRNTNQRLREHGISSEDATLMLSLVPGPEKQTREEQGRP